MLRVSNIHGRCHATFVRRRLVVAAAVVAVWLLGPRAVAADPPDEEVVRAAFVVARQWVDAVAVPHVDEAAAELPLKGARGVCVLLRRSGRVVGVGTDWTGDDLMLRRAVARALGELLGEPAVQSMPDEMRGAVGKLVSIELEIAGAPEPIVARSFEQAGRQLDPGLSGIAMRRDQTWSMIFPAQFRASNTAGGAHRQFLALATDLELPAIGLAELAQKHNVAAYSFRATTLAQAAPTDEPFMAVRGEPVVPNSDVTPEALRAWAEEAATHLLVHLAFAKPVTMDGLGGESPAPEPVGLAGTYNPLADQFDPLIAAPIEQALGALALSKASQSPAISAEVRQQCAEAAAQILLDLTRTTSVETDPFESAPTCAIIVAAASPGLRADNAAIADLHARAADRLMQSFQPTMTFDASLSPHERALVAWGLVRLSLSEPLKLPRSTAEAAAVEAWESVAEQERVALLPWIGWALTDLAGENGALAHADGLRELAAGLCASRIMAGDRAFAADLAGGIPLMKTGRSHPTSQTLRPASWLASALRDERIAPDAVRQARHHELREIMRFVRQLMARDETAWRYRNKPRSIGGIRTATWDLTQPVPAQALGIITLIEAAETLQNAVPWQPKGLMERKSP
jgi:hypothetical protein